MNLGRIGLWAADFDLQPMSKAQEAIAQVEEMGYGAVWVPEAVIREPFASTALLLSATKKLVLATGIASLHARTAQTMQAGWKTLTEAFPDRFLLGIGVSHAPMVQGVHKGTYDKPYSTMVEYLDAMDKGIFFGASPSTEPQRVLAALGPKMLKQWSTLLLLAKRWGRVHCWRLNLQLYWKLTRPRLVRLLAST